jgi:hypothetical protein
MAGPARLRAGRHLLVPAVFLIPAVVSPAAAQWDVRLGANYQDARYGGSTFRSSTQEILARRRYDLSDESNLSVSARLLHDVDFRAHDGLYRGYGDAEFRSTPVDLFLRIRPDQRQAATLPVTWRQEEKSWGGTLHLGRGPGITYNEGRYRRVQRSPGLVRGETRNQRVTSTWNVLGLDLDYGFTRAENYRKVDDPAAGPSPTNTTLDHAGGVSFARTVIGFLELGAGYHRADTRRKSRFPADSLGAIRGTPDMRVVGNQADLRVNAQPWKSVQFSAVGGWAGTKTHGGGVPARLDRNLDASAGVTCRPWRAISVDVQRAFQEQRSGGLTTRGDYLRARLGATGHLNPEVALSGDFAHSEAVARSDEAGASDQLSLGMNGRLRTGAEVSFSAAGSRLVGMTADMRYQMTETAELRLQPVTAVRCNLAMQGFALGRTPNPGSPDRVQYRAELLAAGDGGGSASVSYSSRTIRGGSSGEKYSLSGSASVPWRGSSFSWNGSFSRAGDREAASGRAWGYASAVSVRWRLSRQADVNVSQSRSLPANGVGNSTWIASVQQTIR